MPHPERQAIYDTYKKIVQDIIDSKYYKEYAESEAEALTHELLSAFKGINAQMILNTDWEKKKPISGK
jgi:hypothetical protein